MEAGTTTQQAPPEAQAEKPLDKLFKWSGWTHVGEGADECEQRFTGRCEDEEHFHAWCRLPNPFQQRDIAEKARAAKARKIRALKDPDSDAGVVLVAQLDEVRETGDTAALVDEIVAREWGKDYERALEVVEQREEYEHVEQDREEWLRQRALPEGDRDEEFAELDAHMTRYGQLAEAELKKLQDPQREVLKQKTMDELIDIVRRDRIENAGNEAYLHTYNYWTWYVGTLKPRADKEGKPLRPTERVYSSINELKSASPEVILALQDQFGTLEQAQARGRAAGNS